MATLEPQALTSDGSARATSNSWRAVFALHDVLMLAYLLIVRVLIEYAAPSAGRASIARELEVSVALVVFGCAFARLATKVPAAVRSMVYRTMMVGMVVINYLVLRELLPIVRPDTVDAALLEIDLLLFGVEPSLWLERYNQRPIVEWFSFFYFSYFVIILLYTFVVVWLLRRGRWTTEFALGIVLVYGLGQLGYMAVPGYGPVRHLASEFHGPVDGGLFWGWVSSTVQAGSAMKDIFPSLHTAVPTYLTLFALHQIRRDRRWLWPTVVTGFFAFNIVISTVFLRWHYVIDVFAGLALAFAIAKTTPYLAKLDEARRKRLGVNGPWEFDRRSNH